MNAKAIRISTVSAGWRAALSRIGSVWTVDWNGRNRPAKEEETGQQCGNEQPSRYDSACVR